MQSLQPIAPIASVPIVPIAPIAPDTTAIWSKANAIVFVIIFTIILASSISGINFKNTFENIKNNWGDYRCSPMIMPFASLFGQDTKQNFDFCMGDIFNKHSQPMLNSTGAMFEKFTNLLTIIFGSINSMRGSISTLGGGISTIVQEFTDRLSMFFFNIRITAIRIKSLISRMYAILFSVMYMGLSGMTGMVSFTNTFLFSFLDTFCFPGDTELETTRGKIKIKDIKIGDILLPTNSKVTATFLFYAKGQPMVTIGKTTVSTNHYIIHNGRPIKALSHPNAIKIADWDSELYCLNTHDNHIPINGEIFLDYDETATADKETMNYIEGRVNGCSVNKEYSFTEYCPAIEENTYVKTTDGNKVAKDVKLGDTLVTGSEVVGLIRRVVNETCVVDGKILTPSTLYWDTCRDSCRNKTWKRIGDKYDIIKGEKEMVSFIAVSNSIIELDDLIIRYYMELCSPDSEINYSKRLA